ncbi:MAG: CHAT domain-containing protein, partial [Candidatus Methylumidiphilus sp.]
GGGAWSFRAHAHSAVGTLWPVNDRAARDVMTAFYRALAGGAGKAQALRSAQLQTLRDNNLSHPGYWSAFVLVGDWQ